MSDLSVLYVPLSEEVHDPSIVGNVGWKGPLRSLGSTPSHVVEEYVQRTRPVTWQWGGGWAYAVRCSLKDPRANAGKADPHVERGGEQRRAEGNGAYDRG